MQTRSWKKKKSRYTLAHCDKYALIQFTLLLRDIFMEHPHIYRQNTVHTKTALNLLGHNKEASQIKLHVLDHQSTEGDNTIVRNPSNTAQPFVQVTWLIKEKILASSTNKFQAKLYESIPGHYNPLQSSEHLRPHSSNELWSDSRAEFTWSTNGCQVKICFKTNNSSNVTFSIYRRKVIIPFETNDSKIRIRQMEKLHEN